jgi:hypothetical protein
LFLVDVFSGNREMGSGNRHKSPMRSLVNQGQSNLKIFINGQFFLALKNNTWAKQGISKKL